ncbi:DctP family TRAP transporter solute-binding subunit [Aurantiacibacter rhizosphaerae]|uniref:DctP family TRAP transporter solute-binding subunit n=1 Tax=Aurantiacibacter rhizosphaerae TaxID=2691582 RepID=A0A844XBA6_9SPHN|nr:DctP family TRAP transporter solute-binding subunit [Aurantiacibacter rhizosphaerae]MWV27120.1 DctP family TRAP transporter solute-binding subunit [Aurantiacibacter rhizosphaerae]
MRKLYTIPLVSMVSLALAACNVSSNDNAESSGTAGGDEVAANDGCDPGEQVIKFSHVTNTDKHPKGIAASLLQERINTEMDGRMCMEVYPNSMLYDDDKVLEAMLLGDVQMAAPSLSKFENYTTKLRIFNFPFLFDNIDAVDRFQASSAGQSLLNSMEDKGLQGLSFWHSGMKQLSADRPLIEPTDARGLKFRVENSDVLVAVFDQLGANPQKMSFSEVYGALQTGVVDGQENSWSNIYGQKFFEVQDGITNTDHGVLDYMVVTSTRWWEGLDENDRNDLARVLAEVSTERNQAVNQLEEEARQAVADAGTEIRELTPEQRQAWVDALRPVWKRFTPDVGADTVKAAQAANQG